MGWWYNWKEVIILVIIMSAIVGFISFIVILFIQTQMVVVAEGTIMEFKFIPQGWGGDDYMVLLDDGKWYTVSKTSYYLINIGDYIEILKSGAVNIL